jgi:hypothetical protein
MHITQAPANNVKGQLSNQIDRQSRDDHHIGGSTTKKRERSPHTHILPPLKRTRVDGSSLAIQGKPQKFRSGSADLCTLLMESNRAYFDRTRYISVLEDTDQRVLFYRPRRFGKSLTISMLEHFHGLQNADEHQTFYQVSDLLIDYLDIENLLLFNHSRISMYKMISTETTKTEQNTNPGSTSS